VTTVNLFTITDVPHPTVQCTHMNSLPHQFVDTIPSSRHATLNEIHMIYTITMTAGYIYAHYEQLLISIKIHKYNAEHYLINRLFTKVNVEQWMSETKH